MCCPDKGCVLLANVAQELSAIHFFLGLLLSTATLQFLPPKRALRVHGFRFFWMSHNVRENKMTFHNVRDFDESDYCIFPKRYILWVCMSSFGGCVCEMWTTWMCLPVAVPAHPRILAGRRFLRISGDISPNISGEQGCCGFSGRSDFIYTKNSAIGRSDFIYTKNSARLRYDFIYTKSFLRKIVKNQWYSQKFSALRAPIC